jgi:hypothetical protein
MLKLFLKDVKAGGIFLWAVVPINVVMALQASRSGGGFFWANVACAAFLLVGISMLDWKNEAGPFVHSLPVTRAMVVRGRYVTAAAIGVLSLSVAATVGVARGFALARQAEPWPRWVSGDMALAFVLAFAVVAAIYLPCYFRWGFGKGNVAAALVLAAGIVVSGIVGGPVRGGVPPGRIPEGVALLVERAGLAGGGIIVLGAAAALWWLSSQVAVRAYRHQEF